MLQQERTAFDKGFTKVFHVVAYGSNYYSDLVAKYGADNVFRAASATAEDVPFRTAVSMCLTGRNDQIKVYPGTYSFAAVVTVDKGCTIESATGNENDVVIDLDTAKCAAFIASGVGVKIRNMVFTEATTGTNNMITASGAGFTMENCVVNCAAAVSAAATVVLSGARAVVRGCRLHNPYKGILFSACTGGLVENNYVNMTTNNSAAFGIGATGTCTYNSIRNNNVSAVTDSMPYSILTGTTLGLLQDNISSGATDPYLTTGVSVYGRNSVGTVSGGAAWVIS